MPGVSTNIRIDPEVKKQAQVIFADLGLDLSTAVNIFLRQVIHTQSIPFEITREVPNAETRRIIENARAGRNLSREFHSVAELMEDLYADR